MKILIVNGPNLNMLGMREKKYYGDMTLDAVNGRIADFCRKENIEVQFFQSNVEGEIVGAVQSVRLRGMDGLIINGGAYSHYSIAIADALECLDVPKIEVHMSNIQSREEFRHKSVLTAVCSGTICGFGEYSYILACLAVKDLLQCRA